MSNSLLQVKVTKVVKAHSNYKKARWVPMLIEADKLALAEQKVGSKSEIHLTQQIENLEKQLILQNKEYGENSTEVNKLETQLNESKKPPQQAC